MPNGLNENRTDRGLTKKSSGRDRGDFQWRRRTFCYRPGVRHVDYSCGVNDASVEPRIPSTHTLHGAGVRSSFCTSTTLWTRPPSMPGGGGGATILAFPVVAPEGCSGNGGCPDNSGPIVGVSSRGSGGEQGAPVKCRQGASVKCQQDFRSIQ